MTTSGSVVGEPVLLLSFLASIDLFSSSLINVDSVTRAGPPGLLASRRCCGSSIHPAPTSVSPRPRRAISWIVPERKRRIVPEAVMGEARSTGSSDRQFCLLAGGLALVFLGAVWPRVLKPVNRLWLLFGQALGKVTNPLVAGLLFLVVIAPLGLLLRRMGRLSVRLRKDSPARSYWQETSNAASPAERMHFQF